jgi:hypothetical protein
LLPEGFRSGSGFQRSLSSCKKISVSTSMSRSRCSTRDCSSWAVVGLNFGWVGPDVYHLPHQDFVSPLTGLELFLHRQGPCGGGSFCDHSSGPQQYFSTKLPTKIQFLGSRPAEIHLFVSFAGREVYTVSLSRHYCNSTLGYGRQVLMPTKKKNSPTANRC